MGARHCHFEFHPLPPIPTESRSTHHGDHKDVPRETWNANAMRRWMFYSGASWDDMDRWTRDRNFAWEQLDVCYVFRSARIRLISDTQSTFLSR